jgi:hypothetical protein
MRTRMSMTGSPMLTRTGTICITSMHTLLTGMEPSRTRTSTNTSRWRICTRTLRTCITGTSIER